MKLLDDNSKCDSGDGGKLCLQGDEYNQDIRGPL